MKKKIYIAPSMKVKHIACTHMLCGSDGERSLKMISAENMEDLEEEYSQW